MEVSSVAVEASATAANVAAGDVSTVATSGSHDASPAAQKEREDVAKGGDGEETLSPPQSVAEESHDDVHAMLATAAARQRTFQELRDASLEIGVRDLRKCDYPIAPVPRVSSARRHSARRGSRSAGQVSEPAPRGHGATTEPDAEAARESPSGEAFVWRRHLDAHIAFLLTELRRRPDQLRTLLAAHCSKPANEAHENAHEDEVVLDSRGERVTTRRASSKESALGELHRQGRVFLSANEVYARLTEVGVQFGETIYHQIRKMLVKSVKSGVIDRAANLVRLESMFKVELRRQVTLERLQNTILSKLDMHQKQTTQTWISQEATRNDPRPLDQDRAAGTEMSADPAVMRSQDEDIKGSESMTITTAHHFKMHALERVLSNACRVVSTEHNEGSVTSLPRARSDLLADQIQDKVTAAVYSKNRENYPFWKEPPENGLSREDTAKLLRAVISVFANVSVFASLSVEQLIDITKCTRWKMLGQGSKVCVKGTPMDNLFVVMEGRVAFDSEATTATSGVSATSQPATNRFDDRRSIVSSSIGVVRECYGELGLLSKTELWPFSLTVCSATAKIVTLMRDSFESALLKIFGGVKRLLLARDGSVGKRPTSSPAATRQQIRSAPRPATSSIREQAVTRFQQYRDEYVSRMPEDVDPHSSEESCSATQETSVAEATEPKTARQPSQLIGNVYQHYPTFPVVDGSSAGSHMFRLKCIQPIAFGMKSVGDLIQDEWAPAFPDTSTLVDYMSATESSFLFEKRNVLLKENLRAVCTNLPFQDESAMKTRADEYLSYYQDTQADSAIHESTPVNNSVTASEPINTGTSAGASSASAYAIASIVDGDAMTLGQFADARRRISSKIGPVNGGAVSQSMRNVFGSAATSATLAKHGNAPFVNSCFVPESSFHDDLRNFVGSQAEGDQEDEGDDVDTARGNYRKVMSNPSMRPEVDEDDDSSSHLTSEHSASAGEASTHANPTKARKMALDSIINTMSDRSPAKRKMTDHEAARRVLLQKHLYAANEGPSPSPNTPDGRKKSLLRAELVDPNAGAASHAPLPLRVDLQRRMEAVLAALKMKAKAKLDLVLKYTHADFYDHFPDAVVLWEQAAHYVLKREKALESLRKFELVASDPRRHFRSLSTHRLTEQKERDALFYQLNYASDLCRESLDELEKRCGDVVYFENRQYREKMKKDYTELLYEVEQERLRMIYKGIHPAVADRKANSKMESAHSNQQEEATPRRTGGGQHVPARGVSGSSSILAEPRFALSTPRESIYVSVVDRIAQEEREEREQKIINERAKPQRPIHDLSAQVKQHRQAQLEALMSPSRSDTGHSQASPAHPETSELRTASAVGSTAPQPRIVGSLKQVLESALGRR